MYTKVTNYDQDETLEPIIEKVVTRGNADYRTVYVPKGTYGGVAIPARNNGLNLDVSKIAAAQAWSDQIKTDLS